MKPKIDEVWEVYIKYWPEDTERHMLVKIFYVWQDGRIQFVPVFCYDGDPIWADSCHKFELIRKVDLVDKNKV